MNNLFPLWQALMAQQQPVQQFSDTESPEDIRRLHLEMLQRRNSAVMRQVGPNDARMIPDQNAYMPEDVQTYRNLMPFGQERL